MTSAPRRGAPWSSSYTAPRVRGFRLPPARQAVRHDARARRGGPGGPAGRAVRPAGPQRGGQVDAREDRLRPRAAQRRRGAGDGRARRVGGGAGQARLPRRAVPLSRLAARRGARAGRLGGGGRGEGRGDVEGHAAAARHRTGAGGLAAAADARRADQRPGPGRAADRARPAAGAEAPRRGRAPQLAPAERDRTGLRPRGDPGGRADRGAGLAGRPGAGARRGDRRGRRHAGLPRRDPRAGARHRGGAGGRGRARIRRAGVVLDARGHVPGGGGGVVSGALTIAAYALRESTRRRVFVVVLLLTVAFLGLYAVGTEAAFDSISDLGGESGPVEDEVLTGSTLLGLAMFTTLFLGCVLAVFLTLGAVRGDAERGLLQPLVVRPVGRTELLVGRFLAAAGVCAVYVAAVYTAAMLITGAAGGWWPDEPVGPGPRLVAGVGVVAAPR